MKKLICLLLVTIMILSFSTCKKEEILEDSKNNFEQEKEDITYPILFLRDNSLYWIKDYGESPILVDNGTFLDFYDGVKVNPVNPNEIIRADYTWAKEYYLNTAPDTEGDMLDNISESISNSRILDIGYTPNGNIYSYNNSGNLAFDEIPMYIPDVQYHYYYFDDNSEKCCYITAENEIGYVNTETGWYETFSVLSSEYQIIHFLDYNQDVMYLNCIDSNFQSEFCSFDFNTNTFEIIDSEKFYSAYSNDTKIKVFNKTTDTSNYCYDIITKNIEYSLKFNGDYSDYLKIVKLNDKTVLLAYSNNENSEIILITDEKEQTLFNNPKYEFIQPLNSKELLLLEATDFGTTNLVAYNIKNKDFSIVYENFKGNSEDIIISYDKYKYIIDYSWKSLYY